MTNCFWSRCINVEVISKTSSSSDSFIIWPTSVTLTLEVVKWMFHVPFLHIKQKLHHFILKTMHKCKVMAGISSSYDHFIKWLSSVTLTFSLCKWLFQIEFLTRLSQIILISMHKCKSNGWKKLTRILSSDL